MYRVLLILALVLIACGGETPIWPDSTTGAGGMSSSSATSASSGHGSGAGGGQAGGACSDCGSGTRLKAVLQIGGDGSRHVLDGTWFDSARNERCYSTASPLGKQQCLPALSGAFVSDTAFADNACSAPVAARGFTQGCGPEPTMAYAAKQDVSACPVVTRIYTSGAMLSGSVYMIKSGVCTAVDAASISGLRFYPVGPEVNYADFVSFTETHE